MKKFLVLDIDGTLIRWQLYHAVADQLYKNNLINNNQFEIVKNLRFNWKNRSHYNAYQDYELKLIEIFDKNIQNIEYHDFVKAIKQVFNEYKNQTYKFTTNLIKHFKNKGFLIFAISASHKEIIKLIANYYKFDDFTASEYKITNNKFNGAEIIIKGSEKFSQLNNMVKKHGASFNESVGIGDSYGDKEMLENLDNPIAFNPDDKLLKFAKKSGWKIVIERKNIIYQLKNIENHYVLDKTTTG